ncbi:MAG: hypothetical protein P1U80_05560 [Pseudomonadales bacterium]|nr:hypothetical protein [Pseudomonadales bacterium]
MSLTSVQGHAASDESETGAIGLESMLVTGARQAYRGDFHPLDILQAQLVIDAEAVNLDQALDLSTSVARQNNFGGL